MVLDPHSFLPLELRFGPQERRADLLQARS